MVGGDPGRAGKSAVLPTSIGEVERLSGKAGRVAVLPASRDGAERVAGRQGIDVSVVLVVELTSSAGTVALARLGSDRPAVVRDAASRLPSPLAVASEVSC